MSPGCRKVETEQAAQAALISDHQAREWFRIVKADGFPDRKAKLRHIAAGPSDRQDVQAARSLLTKPRYNRNLFNWKE